MDGRGLWILALCLLVAVPLASGASSDYSITGADPIDTPDRTATIEGQAYDINSLSIVDSSNSVTVDTTVPSDQGYYINIYNPDNQIADNEWKTGSGSETFDLTGFQAGSYAAGLEHDSTVKSAHPILIPGYDVTLSAPSSVTEGGSIDVSGSVSARSVSKHSELSYVEVLVGDNADEVVKTVSQSTGDYSATISISDLDPGTYSVFTNVRGDEKVRERDELLGIEKTTLEIKAAATPTPTPTPTDSGGSGTGGGAGGGATGGGAVGGSGTTGGATTVSETTPEQTATPIDLDQTPTATQPPVRTTSRTITGTGQERTPTQGGGQNPDRTDSATGGAGTEANVITPNGNAQQDPPDGETPGGNGPGFTILAVVVAILSIGAWLRPQ